MSISTGILFGLIALFGWGLADFFAKRVIDKTGDFKALFWMQLLSMIPFFALYLAVDGRFLFPLKDYLMFILTSILGIIGYFMFYKAIRLGNISIISPIQASYVVLTVILAVIFLGERLIAEQTISIAIVFIGLVMTGINFTALKSLRKVELLAGVKEDLISAGCFGFHFVFIGIMVAKYGWLVPVFFFRVFNVIFLLLYTYFFSREFKIKLSAMDNYIYRLFPLIVIFDVAAILGFSLGVNSEYVSIVTPVALSFPLVTVTLASIFYKERLDKIQIIGIILLISGIILLSYFS